MPNVDVDDAEGLNDAEAAQAKAAWHTIKTQISCDRNDATTVKRYSLEAVGVFDGVTCQPMI